MLKLTPKDMSVTMQLLTSALGPIDINRVLPLASNYVSSDSYSNTEMKYNPICYRLKKKERRRENHMRAIIV